jgi:hypothetical protein
VARRTAEDQYIGINAGEFAYWDGISELSTVTNESIQTIKLFSAVSRFTFKDFIEGTIIILEINSLAFPMHNGT